MSNGTNNLKYVYNSHILYFQNPEMQAKQRQENRGREKW